jgi:hypothetical protein
MTPAAKRQLLAAITAALCHANALADAGYAPRAPGHLYAAYAAVDKVKVKRRAKARK